MAKPKTSRAKQGRATSSSKGAALPARPIDIVYLGPSLPLDIARDALPAAELRGPVAVGDVLRVVDEHVAGRTRVGRIAIIDGYFERMAAVWHKELLLAIEAGIDVWGASSMGALRAAELAPFGMRGVGTIYERFASGELVCDDEVAVAHLPAEFGYTSTSIALVDMRDALARAKLPAADRRRLVELARGRFYRERTWENLVADAKAARVPAASIAKVASLGKATSSFAGTKASDARLLLDAMRRARKSSKPRKLVVPRTWALAQLRATLAD